MKRVLTIIFILAITIGATVLGYQYARPTEPQSLEDDPTFVEIVQVERETLLDTVEASGRIEPRAEVDMKFEIGGVVADVLVERGQYVTRGTVLAQLATDDLDLEIRQAEIDLTQREAELAQLFEPALTQKIAAAQANVASAQLKLDELLAGPDQDKITKAEVELSRTQIELKKAQWDYDQVAYRGDIGAMPQADKLQQATLDYEAALADYNIAVRGPTEAEIAEARSTLAAAEANLAELLQEPSAADIALKQAAVDKAQLTLEEKQSNLAEAVLVAPTDGVILEISIEPGERVLNEANEAAVVIADTSAYLLKVEVDEIDIGRIARNQEATIVLDAYIEQEFTGRVADISPRPAKDDENAIVTYEVTLTLDTTSGDPGILSGMTAYATIETRQLKDVVVVPNRAIQVDRTSTPSETYVEKLDEEGLPIRTPIELGLGNGEVTQVVTGLDEGDEVIIRSQEGFRPAPGL
jgi:HlyD family secretion protein